VRQPETSQSQLSNGLRVVSVHRPALPWAHAHLSFVCGSVWDPPGKEGLANLTAVALDAGITPGAGTEWAMDVTADLASFAIGATLEDLPEALDLLGETTRGASLSQTRVTRARDRLTGELTALRDDAETVHEALARRAVFPSHGYGHCPMGLRRTLARVAHRDVVAFYNAHYGPANAVLVVVGAASSRWVEDGAKRVFGAWRAPAVARRAAPLPPTARTRSVWVAHVPQTPQAVLALGTRTVPQGSPEAAAGRLAMTAWGAGFSSRLMRALRVQSGLTYSPTAELQLQASAGSMRVQTQTATHQARQVVEAVLASARQSASRGFSRQELERARAYASGRFPFEIELDALQASWLATTHMGEGACSPSDYLTELRSTPNAAVNAFARRYFPLTRYALTATGDAAALTRQLRRFGGCRRVPLDELL
jgi:zinc protease